MIKLLLLILTIFCLSGCVNKHGISLQYYSDCDEYYDLQGYYHKECGKDDIITYKGAGKALEDFKDTAFGKEVQPQGNVW